MKDSELTPDTILKLKNAINISLSFIEISHSLLGMEINLNEKADKAIKIFHEILEELNKEKPSRKNLQKLIQKLDMKPIERLRRAIEDYEQETGELVDSIKLKERRTANKEDGSASYVYLIQVKTLVP